MDNTNGNGAPVPPPQGNGGYTAPNQPTQPGQSAQGAQPLPHHAQHSQQGYYQQPAYQAPSAQPVEPAKKSTGPKTFLLAFAGAALACIIALSGFGIYNAMSGGSGSSDSGSSTVIGSSGNGSIDATDDDATLAEAVAQKALPSVVAVDVYTSQSSGMYGYGAGSGSDASSLTQSSLGSGVVLSEDGYIITNYHVVEGGEAFKVTIEGEEYDAEVVGTDPSSDLAVLKAQNATGLTPIEIGDSSDLIIGEWVMTLGSPFGLEQSVATGIVSATSRSQIMNSQTDGSTMIYANLIQTDAAINPGNSGGALFDSYGNVIGIVYAKSSSVSIEGIGYAIPVNNIKDLVAQMINDPDSVKDQTKGSQIMLGITIRDITEDMSKQYSMPVGVYITEVSSMSAAERAGLQKGDIITEFAGETVTSADDLNAIKAKQTSGDTVSVKIDRNGKEMTLDLVIPQPTEVDTASNK